jgi:hypothetical protein
MTFTSAHTYRKLEAAAAAAGTAHEKALQSGDLRALTSSTEVLRRTTAEFRKALAHDLIEVPGKGRLLRAEHGAIQEFARENQIDVTVVFSGIKKIEGGRVRNLNLGERNLTSIRALARLTGLMELYLPVNELTDITPLAGLRSLTWLDLSLNKLTDLTPLATLSGVTELDLACNRLTDITPLANLTRLTFLSLANNELTNISPLANLTELKRLNLIGSPLASPYHAPVLAALEARRCQIWT